MLTINSRDKKKAVRKPLFFNCAYIELLELLDDGF